MCRPQQCDDKMWTVWLWNAVCFVVFFFWYRNEFTAGYITKVRCALQCVLHSFNPLRPNDPYKGRTAPLTSKRCILYIYSTNIGTEYFERDIYSPFFPLQNAVCFIILTYLVPVLFTFYIHGGIKLKKNPAPKGLNYIKAGDQKRRQNYTNIYQRNTLPLY